MKQIIEISNGKQDHIDRNLYLCKNITADSIEDIVKNIVKINEEDDQNGKWFSFNKIPYIRYPIKIYIDTYGGNIYQMFGLISVIEKSKTPVHTIVTGCAMSAGFMILIAGHRRFAYEHSTSMYHQISAWSVGTIKEISETHIQLKQMQKMTEKVVLRKTKISKEKLKEIYNLKSDWYMTSAEAKKFSVIDEII